MCYDIFVKSLIILYMVFGDIFKVMNVNIIILFYTTFVSANITYIYTLYYTVSMTNVYCYGLFIS